jgi:hypothetical protein
MIFLYASAVSKTAFLHPVQHESGTIPCTLQGGFANAPQECEHFESTRMQVVHEGRVVVLIVEFAWDSAVNRFLYLVISC